MKIIFDNEKQKEAWFKHMVDDYCPGVFGLPDVNENHCKRYNSCDECWSNCGLEMDVEEAKE